MPRNAKADFQTAVLHYTLDASMFAAPILVVTQAGCAYQTTVTDTFVQAGAGASGTGVISLSLDANTGPARNTTFEIAGQPFTITQGAFVSPCDVTQDGKTRGRAGYCQ